MDISIQFIFDYRLSKNIDETIQAYSSINILALSK
jgi:hypothetical protein